MTHSLTAFLADPAAQQTMREADERLLQGRRAFAHALVDVAVAAYCAGRARERGVCIGDEARAREIAGQPKRHVEHWYMTAQREIAQDRKNLAEQAWAWLEMEIDP